MSDTIALITGGNRGLGRATASALADAGVDVVITYRSNAQEAADVVADLTGRGRKAAALQLDTGVVGSFAAFVSELRTVLADVWGRDSFDYLVNNAGHAASGAFADITEEQLDGLIDVHFKGVFFLTQALLPVIADGGRIVNLSSGLARFVRPTQSAYASVKGAVEVLSRYLASELGPRGITVNVVAPGPIGTDFGGGYLRDNQQMREALASDTALGRVGEPDDIGGLIATVLTGATGWMTGQRIEVSGGSLL